MKKTILIFAALALAACGQDNHPQTQYVQQPATTYQQQAPVQYAPQPQVVHQDSGIGTGTAIVGAAAVGTAAYMLGKSNAEKAAATAQAPTKPVIVQQPVQQRTYTQVAPAPQVQPAPPKAQPAPVNTFKPVAAKNMTTVVQPKTSFSSKRK